VVDCDGLENRRPKGPGVRIPLPPPSVLIGPRVKRGSIVFSPVWRDDTIFDDNAGSRLWTVANSV
jgi:hypothetical protein